MFIRHSNIVFNKKIFLATLVAKLSANVSVKPTSIFLSKFCVGLGEIILVVSGLVVVSELYYAQKAYIFVQIT